MLLYMTQEGRGIGLLNKLKAYELQEAGLDTVEANLELGFPADAREYGIGNQILADLGLTTIRILTNNPKKLTGIEGFGLTVVEQVPIETAPTDENRRYLETKRDKLGHRLHHQDLRFDRGQGRMSERIDEIESRLREHGRLPPQPRSESRRRRRARARSPVAGRSPLCSGARARSAVARARRRRAPRSRTATASCPEASTGGARSAVVVSRFNGEITNRLLERALAELEEVGVPRDAIMVMPVPGAFELPLAAMALAKTRRYACIVALGCVIRGETPHFDYVASEAASGLQLAALETGVPVSFGVLTVETREQAEERIDRAADAVRTAPSRWPTCSRSSGRRPPAACTSVATLFRPWQRSAQSVERSRPSVTTGATRWWPRSGASTRTSSASACSSTDGATRAYVCTRCLKAGKVEKAL